MVESYFYMALFTMKPICNLYINHTFFFWAQITTNLASPDHLQTVGVMGLSVLADIDYIEANASRCPFSHNQLGTRMGRGIIKKYKERRVYLKKKKT